MRIEQLFFEQMATHMLQPLGFDIGNTATKQSRGLHQFASHNPSPWLFAQVRTRVRVKLDAARAQILMRVAGTRADSRCIVSYGLCFKTNIAQQPRQHRHMQFFVTRGLGVEAPFVFADHGQQLRMRVTPFTHAPHVDKVLPQQGFVFAVGEFVFLLAACASLL